ncbi:WD40-repeat-containing domain protein [Phakopsora pachyrhizi]|nr:WD40-repeat-containing domain protein [Phakopsora pachyrhizi]
MRGHTQKVYSVVLDHFRSQCAPGSMDNTVRLWDLRTGSCLKVLGEHSSLVGLLGLSPNRLVSAAADSTLRIWDPLDGISKQELRGHLGAITCFSHDQFRVISGADRTLKLWNPSNGELPSGKWGSMRGTVLLPFRGAMRVSTWSWTLEGQMAEVRKRIRTWKVSVIVLKINVIFNNNS